MPFRTPGTLAGWVILIFVIWWVVQDPASAGALIHGIFGFLGHAAHSGQTVVQTSTGK